MCDRALFQCFTHILPPRNDQSPTRAVARDDGGQHIPLMPRAKHQMAALRAEGPHDNLDFYPMDPLAERLGDHRFGKSSLARAFTWPANVLPARHHPHQRRRFSNYFLCFIALVVAARSRSYNKVLRRVPECHNADQSRRWTIHHVTSHRVPQKSRHPAGTVENVQRNVSSPYNPTPRRRRCLRSVE